MDQLGRCSHRGVTRRSSFFDLCGSRGLPANRRIITRHERDPPDAAHDVVERCPRDGSGSSRYHADEAWSSFRDAHGDRTRGPAEACLTVLVMRKAAIFACRANTDTPMQLANPAGERKKRKTRGTRAAVEKA